MEVHTPDGGTYSSSTPNEASRTIQFTNETRSHTVMALEMNKTAIGCAFFSSDTKELSIAEDIPAADTAVFDKFLSQIQPTTIILSTRAQKELQSFVLSHPDIKESNEMECIPANITLKTVPSSNFNRSMASEFLSILHGRAWENQQGSMLTGNEANDSENAKPPQQEPDTVRRMRVGSNKENVISICCANAVLLEMKNHGYRYELNDYDGTNLILSMSQFTLENCVMIDTETARALQIMEYDGVQNSNNVISRNESHGEPHSIFSIFKMSIATSQGKNALRKRFLRPTMELKIIEERQLTTEMLLHGPNIDITKKAAHILRGIPNMRSIALQLRKGLDAATSKKSTSRSVWTSICRFTSGALRLREVMGKLDGVQNNPILSELIVNISQPSLLAVGNLINQVIDFQASIDAGRTSIKPGVSQTLDRLKRMCDGMGSFLHKVKESVVAEISPFAAERVSACTMLPHIGFLLIVKVGDSRGQDNFHDFHDRGELWERVYISEADNTIAFKNRHMRELDERFGDIYGEILDLEVEILHKLSEDILAYEADLVSVSDCCGDIDLEFAFAFIARKHNMVPPQMVLDPILSIEQGRHILQEQLVPAFIPNDCHIDLIEGTETGGSRESFAPEMLALTGPNSSGKSIYLKQAALIVFLAHIGSYVPANRAIVGVTDRILARISTRESVSHNQSAFAIDLRQIAYAIQRSTPLSLIIVDEFGKGTNIEDGVGLMSALFDHLAALGSDRPRTIIATHLHEVFVNCHADESSGLRHYHMKVRSNAENDSSNPQVSYLFKALEGCIAQSFGAQCAHMNGIPNLVVQRANFICSAIQQNTIDIGQLWNGCLLQDRTQMAQAEHIARLFVDTDLTDSNRSTGIGAYEFVTHMLH